MRNKNNPRSEENPLPTSPLAGGGASISSLDKGRARVGLSLPKLRFAEFLGAGEWDLELIGSIAKVTTGNKDTQDKNENGIYPFFVRSQNIEKIDSFALDCEAILTSGDGVGVGKNYHYINGKFNFHQRVYCIYGFNEDIYGKFIYCYFSEKFYQRVMQLSAKNSVDSIRRSMITDMAIAIPKKKEQQKIADCLSTLDDRIETENQKLAQLKTHKKALMQQLFPAEGETVPRLRFAEFLGAGEWEVRKLGDICKSFSGGTPLTTNKNYYNGEIPFIRSGEIDKEKTELFISEEGFNKSSAKIIRKGDVLIALYGANSGEVAISKIDGAINQAIMCMTNFDCNTFAYQFLLFKQAAIVSKYLQGGQGNLSGEIIKLITFSSPTLPEQQKISDCLSILDELINLQTQKIATLKTHKKGMMQQLFPQNTNEGTV